MSTINERLSLLAQHLDLNQNQFAESVGTSSGRISNIVQGRNKPDYKLLHCILTTYKKVSPDWLLLGEGEVERTTGELEGKALIDELTEIEQKIREVKGKI